mmetsp:Transcript_24957/g.58034  ORF Transcript_24957/g.58034 Transcript_24957/m.58034 type:complete len:514 (-) Transcript_24957:78-1619(-)
MASVGDFVKAIAHAALVVCPVIQFILTISSKDIVRTHFRPCNEEPCVYMRVREHRDFALPSSVICSPLFLGIQNGVGWDPLPKQCAWSPTKWVNCMNKTTGKYMTKDERQDRCAAKRVMDRIYNPAGHEWCMPVLMLAMIVKGLGDCVHDCLLLCEYDKSAEKVAIVSLLALATSTALSFMWIAGVPEVYSSYENGSGECACYYVREAPFLLIGVCLPLSLLIHFVFRSDNVLRALTHGLYLYSWNDNVPMRLLRRNPLEGTYINRSLLMRQVVGDAGPGNAGPEAALSEDSRTAMLPGPKTRSDGDSSSSVCSGTGDSPEDGSMPMFKHRVPKLPSLSKLPRIVSRRFEKSHGCSPWFIVPTLLEIASCLERTWYAWHTDTHDVFFFLQVCYLMVGVAMVCVLPLTSSKLFTPELRGGVLMVWLQMFTIRRCSSIMMGTLYYRTAKWLFHLTHSFEVPANWWVPHVISDAIIVLSLIYVVWSYKCFLDEHEGEWKRPIIIDDEDETTDSDAQ